MIIKIKKSMTAGIIHAAINPLRPFRFFIVIPVPFFYKMSGDRTLHTAHFIPGRFYFNAERS